MKEKTINYSRINRVCASELSLNDPILFGYTPYTQPQYDFQTEIAEIIKDGIKDFWTPCCDIAMDEGKLIYQPGLMPAMEEKTKFWYEEAKSFLPEFGSRLFEPREYLAQMAIILKDLTTEGGFSVKEAWEVMCDDSSSIGNFEYANRKAKLEKTGKREVPGGWYDLGNLFKLTYSEKEGFQLFGGAFCTSGQYHAVTKKVDIGYSFSYCSNAIGKILFESEPK